MKLSKIGIVFLLLVASPSQAFENYFSNIFSPIPPGCVTLSQIWDVYNPSAKQIIAGGTIQLTTIEGEERDVTATIWQKGCADSQRRVIVLEIDVPDNFNGLTEIVITPSVWGSEIPGDANRKRMRPVLEPNSHIATDELRLLAEGSSAEFFIDTISVLNPTYALELVMNPAQYNGSWELEIEDVLTGIWTASIPSYNNQLRPSRITFTGRLSGNWVTPNKPDQGFVIAFNELANDISGLLFFSWYTFDNAGKPLWLTGASAYEIDGTSEVTFNLDYVTNGQFLGSAKADRTVAGTATIRAFDCRNLSLTYNLNSLGLGSGTIQLKRVFSLEIQGNACSDLQAKIQGINDGA